jgi:hypothetical protein
MHCLCSYVISLLNNQGRSQLPNYELNQGKKVLNLLHVLVEYSCHVNRGIYTITLSLLLRLAPLVGDSLSGYG